MSQASSFYHGLKNLRAKKTALSSSRAPQTNPAHYQTATYGISSLPSDNINKVITNQFQTDYITKKQEKIDKHLQEEKERKKAAKAKGYGAAKNGRPSKSMRPQDRHRASSKPQVPTTLPPLTGKARHHDNDLKPAEISGPHSTFLGISKNNVNDFLAGRGNNVYEKYSQAQLKTVNQTTDLINIPKSIPSAPKMADNGLSKV